MVDIREDPAGSGEYVVGAPSVISSTQWATVEDVAELLGVTVTPSVRTQAATSIGLHIGLIESVARPDISERDRYWLKLATCYQAAWLAAQPDYLERNDVATASQDGESATYRPDAHTLAPLARKAIKRLSWRGPRTLVTPRQGSGRIDILSEDYDDSLAWKRV